MSGGKKVKKKARKNKIALKSMIQKVVLPDRVKKFLVTRLNPGAEKAWRPVAQQLQSQPTLISCISLLSYLLVSCVPTKVNICVLCAYDSWRAVMYPCTLTAYMSFQPRNPLNPLVRTPFHSPLSRIVSSIKNITEKNDYLRVTYTQSDNV